MVLQEKWDKTKCLIAKLEEMVALDCLPLTRLLQIRAFLMYVVAYVPVDQSLHKGATSHHQQLAAFSRT